ncbi:transposase [Streptomyces sp. NPDC086023]|uniref:transposase n=1 Tax=Streptomyces sp. NPDC086023 TaxID=3365746 RepID=UPI0037D1615E
MRSTRSAAASTVCWAGCSTSPWLGSEALRHARPLVVLSVLTDAQWARIEPLLPDRTPRRGGRRRDHRQVIDAIAWKYRTESPWMDLPVEFGSRKGACSRLRNWAIDGTWERVFTTLLAQADADEDLSWVVPVDSTVVRAHQHAGGGGGEAAADKTVPGRFVGP